MVDCGCPETWLIEWAGHAGSGWDRRILGTQLVGDWHIAHDEPGLHVWDGNYWLATIR